MGQGYSIDSGEYGIACKSKPGHVRSTVEVAVKSMAFVKRSGASNYPEPKKSRGVITHVDIATRCTTLNLPSWLQSAVCKIFSGENAVAPANAGGRRDNYLRRLGIFRTHELHAAKMPGDRQVLPQPKLEPLCEFAGDTDDGWKRTTSETSENARSVATSICSGSDTLSFTSPDLIAHGGSLDGRARLKFLRKLSYQKVWIPKAQRPPSHQTVIIFDWDDTLLCSSYLNSCFPGVGLQSLPEYDQLMIKAIEKTGAKLLELALSLGQTFIITNALRGWVECSAQAWAPAFVPLLQKVHVVSARSMFEAEYPGEAGKWKAEAFLQVKRKLNSQGITNIVALGDSDYEMDAAEVMGKECNQASIKLVKFAQFPAPVELLRQQERVILELPHLVGTARNVRIRLQRPQALRKSG